MGGWKTAQSPILKTTITLARLKKRGYIAMLELYHHIRSRQQTAVSRHGVTYGGVLQSSADGERRTVSLLLTVVYSIIPTFLW
jgi:hypothetical protein